ncbi:CRISPR-associated protein Cas1 [Neisseria sp. HSC-16F19]|nr:CRISPR-associated endonuclease Cas1 [Neisseria sp. HSC-16F19]MCP2041862.1 CRISPR-associated protein Cas1 [Neisseria sp. HSC-16F19]
MCTLFIDRKNLSLRTDGAALALYEQEQRVGTIPLRVLQRVCIRGEVQLSASVLGKLGEQGVGVLVLNGRKRAPALMMPAWKVDGLRRAAQFACAQDSAFCLRLARQWVLAKIDGQRALLQTYADKNATLHAQLAKPLAALDQAAAAAQQAADRAVLQGCEGAAAAHYFAALAALLPPSLQFHGRRRRPPTDAFNAVLSLGYTLLHFEWVKQLYLAGLDPFVGFYHALAHGRESLACDLIEPMRPLYDAWAMDLFAAQTLRPEDFSLRDGACQMGKAARLRFYPAFEAQAKLWRPQMYQAVMALVAGLAAASGQEGLAADSPLQLVE